MAGAVRRDVTRARRRAEPARDLAARVEVEERARLDDDRGPARPGAERGAGVDRPALDGGGPPPARPTGGGAVRVLPSSARESSMVCERCGAAVEVAGLFPGARVRCDCGAEHRVPRPAAPRARPDSPYRRPPDDAPPARAAPPGALACPRCREPLAPSDPRPESERAYGCEGCQGVFLETGALRALRETRAPPPPYDLSRETPPRRVPTARYVRCPRCADVMNRHEFGPRSGVVVDTCETHGVWFDRGELERTLLFVAEGGLDGADLSPAFSPRRRDADLARAAAELRTALAADSRLEARRLRLARRETWWLLFDLLDFFEFGSHLP
jgi:Zn-finger nucleic acid-binding protein